jgi:mannose-6-phosphate isomerase
LPSLGLEEAREKLRSWVVRDALPLWAAAGFDQERGRFEERLTLDGRPIVDVPIRLLVQARQIFSFGVAKRSGWHKGAGDLVEAAYASMVSDYHRADGKDGWVFSIRRDGAVADPRRDLYGHAFVLLAIASYVAATGKRGALGLADETLDYLDRAMRAQYGGGYVEAVPSPDAVRRQNPHMHLFEGLLALWLVSNQPRYLARAESLFELFCTKFFQPRHGVLGEYYDEKLQPASGIAGEIVEPGHHYEWIWLLRRFEAASGRGVQAYIDDLYGHAASHGHAPSGLIVDELLRDGRVHTPSHRAWPVTEAIKANVVEAARGRRGAEARAAALVDVLLGRFLAPATPGGWIDRLDPEGNPATDFMPATTLYHVVCALEVLGTPTGKA